MQGGGSSRPYLQTAVVCMTVPLVQSMRGAVRFADNEIIPHLPGGKGIGAGVALALVMDGGRDYILGLRDNPAVKLMHIMDEQGNIDIDRLYSAARPKFENKLSVDVPLIGSLKFDQNDVDKLYKYIQEA